MCKCEAVKSSFSPFVAPREEVSPPLLPAWKRELSPLEVPGQRGRSAGGCPHSALEAVGQGEENGPAVSACV